MGDGIYIRPFEPDEWELLKDMRLHALKSSPEVYCGNYEDSASRDDQRWKDSITDENTGIFGLFDQDKLIGITGVVTSRENPKHAIFVMTFIEPEYRGRGLTKYLYKARLDWAIQNTNLEKIILSHRAGNEASRRAMIKHGFQYTGKEKISWPDCAEEFELKYELNLESLREA